MKRLLAGLTRRLRRASTPPPRHPALSFGSWRKLSIKDASVVAVCHPDWRGIRAAAETFGVPLIYASDASIDLDSTVVSMTEAKVGTVVFHGYPPGSRDLLTGLHGAGIATRVVLHSSMAQHGAEPGEADVINDVLRLARSGVVGRVGFVKEGLAEAFRALGYDAAYVPNKTPVLPRIKRVATEQDTFDVGVFAVPFWRKNVPTQLGAVALLNRATAHVMEKPDLAYLDSMPIIEHGELPWKDFVSLQGSMDLNLYVTLSECHPMTPLESYTYGVPCLTSPTSALFSDDEVLRRLTVVSEVDNPRAIAVAARHLYSNRVEAVDRAKAWMVRWDRTALELWEQFVA